MTVTDLSKVEYFGLGAVGTREVHVLCRRNSVSKMYVSFTCVNGGWNGKYFPDTNTIAFQIPATPNHKAETMTQPVVLLWAGSLPSNVANDYNAAIAWINSQV